MNSIEFKRTSNIFINVGIVALHRFIEKFRKYSSEFGEIRNELLPDSLIVENEFLLKLLEEVYYFMGGKIYDTASAEQIRKNENVYYSIDQNKFFRFPKMNTYGLTQLLTNNAQGTTRKKENSPKIKQVEKSDPDLANKIKTYFEDNKLKLLSKVYLNEPYSKITTLHLEEKYFIRGEKTCPILNEGFKYLVEGTNISPFFSGLKNFNSQLEVSDKKVSIKALYLLRFSPALSMYAYYNGYESFTSSFFSSNSLININNLYADDFFYLKDEMENMKLPFHRNIKFATFSTVKKDGQQFTIDPGVSAYSPQEITFLLLYTFYRKKFQTSMNQEGLNSTNDPFQNSPFETVPISLVTLKADKFASTMRPNFFEEYNNVKFTIRLIHLMETSENKRIPFKDFWKSLMIELPKYQHKQKYDKSRAFAERQIRQHVISNILDGKSILSELEQLFSKSYLILANGENCGFRRYDILTEFLKLYEPTINFGGIKMNKSLQQRAIKLGNSIGFAIVNYDNAKTDNEKKTNAKNGRKYLITLHKARNIDQFREALIRIQNRFALTVSAEILENMTEQNFKSIKQYAQISALNQLNHILSTKRTN